MESTNQNKYIKYSSEIKYDKSSFKLNLNFENYDKFKISLIYADEIEYSSEFNFTSSEIKNPNCKTKDEFLAFLNECSNEYYFYISDINKEYCILTIKFSDNILNKNNFKLLNKDKNKDIESIKRNKLLNYNVDALIEECKKSEAIILDDIFFQRGENCYIFNLNKYSYIIFISKIKVIIHIEDDEKNQIIEEIRTNNDIYEILKKHNINENDVFLGEYKLEEVINVIDTYIEDNILKLRFIKKIIPETKFGENAMRDDINYKREEYSEYFSEYFENYNPNNNQKIFRFQKNKLRNEIFRKVSRLSRFNQIKKYKITGPFSTGKSITLFVYSRLNPNVIYINLKTLRKNKSDYKNCLKIIFSECRRVKLNKDNFDEKISLLKIEENILSQLLYIIEIILDLAKNTIVLILDQYKEENINYEPNFVKKIKEFFKRENFRLVLCSSINDHDIRGEVIKTWREFNGNNPHELDKNTQDYYFYYFKLFSRRKSQNLSYKLFRNKYKYLKKVKNDKSLDNTYNRIIKKLKNFQIYNKDKLISLNEYNLSDIFVFLKKYINTKLDKSTFFEVISMIPLKYFPVIIKDDYYLLKPAFPFINYCISKYINMKDCNDYFSNKKYSYISFLSNKVKGEYFEFAAIKALEDSNIIKLPYKNQNIEEVTVNEIVKMDQLESSFDDLIKEFEVQLNNENNENQEEEEEEEEEEEGGEEEKEEKTEEENDKEKQEEQNEIIEEVEDNEQEEDEKEENDNYIFIDEENRININLKKAFQDEKIDKKIEKKISEYYLKDFANIFDENTKTNIYLQQYEYLIDQKEKEYLKRIKDYKREIYEKEIIERKKNILKKINEKKKAKIKNKDKIRKKTFLKIPLNIKYKQKKVYESKSRYKGNETFYITQSNPNGELLDFAVLYGKKNEKIFLGFQIKCYSSNTDIDSKFLERDSIKKVLSPILLNSIKLFNCLIKEWHYYLIYYYNLMDESTKYGGYKAQISTFKNKIEYLLYDPVQKVFYSKDFKTEIKNLELTYYSNLDNISYLNNCYNYLSISENVFFKTNSDEFDEDFGNGLNQFVNDFKQYSENPENILNILSQKMGIKNLFYCLSFHSFRIELPIFNQLILYKKKESSHFIAIYFDEFYKVFDLEKEKNININGWKQFIDFEYKYTYILRFYGRSMKRKELRNNDEDYIKIPEEPINFKVHLDDIFK